MSTAAHLVVFTMLGLVPPPSEVLAMEDMEIEVVEPEPAKVDPPPPPPPPPEPEPEPKRAARAEPEQAPPPPEPQTAPPPEEVADFTGVTLTADGDGASWSTVVGSGAPLKGPVGKINRDAAPQQAAKAVPTGPRFVPAGSLARKPQQPPGLDLLLKQNYPRRASLQGVSGKARVLLRILPSGRANAVRVIDESPESFGFGLACIETLRGSPPFSPAIDRSGEAVATEVPFSCRFEVDD